MNKPKYAFRFALKNKVIHHRQLHRISTNRIHFKWVVVWLRRHLLFQQTSAIAVIPIKLLACADFPRRNNVRISIEFHLPHLAVERANCFRFLWGAFQQVDPAGHLALFTIANPYHRHKSILSNRVKTSLSFAPCFQI